MRLLVGRLHFIVTLETKETYINFGLKTISKDPLFLHRSSYNFVLSVHDSTSRQQADTLRIGLRLNTE